MDKIDAITKKLIEQRKLEEKEDKAKLEMVNEDEEIENTEEVTEEEEVTEGEEVENNDDDVENVEEDLEDVVTGVKGKVDGDEPDDVEDATKHVELGAKKTKDTPVKGVTKVAEEEEIDEDVVVHIHTDTDDVYIDEQPVVEDPVLDEPYEEDEYEYYESEDLEEGKEEEKVEHVSLKEKKCKDDDDKKKKKDDDEDEDDDKKEESKKFDEKKLEALFKGYIDKSYSDLSESYDTPKTIKITEAFLNHANNSLDLQASIAYEGEELDTSLSISEFEMVDGEHSSPVTESEGVLFGASDKMVLEYVIKDGAVYPDSLSYDVKLIAQDEELQKEGKISVKKRSS